jgi:hypothetical protein
MAFRDWLGSLPRPDRFTGRGRSWPWIAAAAAVGFLFFVASTGSLGAVAELVRALAALCWPALVYVVLRTYQEEIRALLHRIRRAKPGPGELELRADVDQLEQDVRAELERLPARAVVGTDEENGSDERRILDAAARSSRLGLMELSLAIEPELQRLLATAGTDTAPGLDGSIRGSAECLVERGLMSRSLASCVVTLADLRDRLVHAHAAHENEAMRSIDLGTKVLRIIRAFSAQANGDPERRLSGGGMEQVARGV